MNTDEDRIERALDSGRRAAGSPPWRDPDEIRRIARRRTITRRSLFGVAGLVAAGGIADALWPRGTSGHDEHAPPLASGLRVDDRSGSAVQLVADVHPFTAGAGDAALIARAEQSFALDLLRAAGGGSDNIVLSPSSLAIALAMLQVGAGGRTASEIGAVLHTSELSAAQQAAGWAALVELQSSSAGSVVESANAVWQQRGLTLRAAYMASLARYFRTGVWQVDFAHDLAGASSAINEWVSTHTHGKITKLFDAGEITTDTVLVLANAEYFKAAWQYKFDPKLTADGTFFRADGSRATVPFMNYKGRLASTATPKYMAVQLPYAGGRFAAQVIMPMHGTLPQLLGSLTPDDFAAIAKAPAADGGELLMPKFTAHTYTQLNSPLQQLGMRTAFTGDADFGAMSPTALMVQTVVQRDYLKVDEEGTEAAAVTGVGMVPQSAQVPPKIDHPFLFVVRDTATGAILFAGQIQDPSTS
ncbi:MAG TPA: serpin family protein [Jatrophihabitans sp.]|jgi:serpin B